jgi:hypothetical protein
LQPRAHPSGRGVHERVQRILVSVRTSHPCLHERDDRVVVENVERRRVRSSVGRLAGRRGANGVVHPIGRKPARATSHVGTCTPERVRERIVDDARHDGVEVEVPDELVAI